MTTSPGLPAQGGGRRRRTYYGVTIGILMVETYFRRFVGDIGNAETWPFPVQYRIVRGALPRDMTQLQDFRLLDAFKQGMQELIEAGVDGITTTCGFLALYQRELAACSSVPVATSALLQVPVVGRTLPGGKRVGVLTYAAEALSAAHLEAVGADPATPIGGLPPGSEFRRAIAAGDDSVPYETWREEVLQAAGELLAADPSIGAIVSECTNLTPFSAAITERFGIPVFDAVSLVHWFHAGLRPFAFPPR
ncbi:Aspartate/glutamate racemase family protein [Rhodovastum atsumiense]|uniref:Aspartate/glutamate racemase family protein n=1 Tax=Rhodovastum atsumiense TaxID=504468 RepID=A0A5M6J037_9PROT|nr:aspartate/glutamate racemase family protein [Rhodovastum atsumiense]KAA5613447.1 aspartate/glutamate racemase family protein [Rhodovastum atsumiense]CAH2603182.1 Aspartate/glutamate racemase family protein [Rhodovastum atsumiense]